jgi:hypothetical protein
VSIRQLETQLGRLQSKIEACQAQLTELKGRRKDVKARLEAARKAARDGKPLPAEAESGGLTETVVSSVTEAVVNPISRLISTGTTEPQSGPSRRRDRTRPAQA